jgi:hypothetical protein
MEKLLAGDDPQDGVSQEFELLVVSTRCAGEGCAASSSRA